MHKRGALAPLAQRLAATWKRRASATPGFSKVFKLKGFFRLNHGGFTK